MYTNARMGRYNGVAPKGWIYILRFPNGKVYIGQTRRLEDRINEHRRSEFPTKLQSRRVDNKTKLKHAIRKYGWSSVKVEILTSGLDPSSIDAEEVRRIREFNSVEKGYNTLPGGEVKPWDIPEVAEHLRAVHKTEEYRAKQRASWNSERRESQRKSNQDRHKADNGDKIRSILADARSKRTAESFARTLAKQHAKRDAALALLPPHIQEKKRRAARKDSERHARNRAAMKLQASQTGASTSSTIAEDPDPDWF